MATVKKETRSVKTFKAKKNATYLQCDNAYNPKHPYCHNTIKGEHEYLTVIRKFDDGCMMRYDFCEGCMRAKLSEEEIEKLRKTKGTETKTKSARIQALVNEIRCGLKSYERYDPIGWVAIDAGLDEIVRITKERGK